MADALPGLGIVFTFGAVGALVGFAVAGAGAVVGCWSVGVWSGSVGGVIFRGMLGSLGYGSVGESAIVSLP